jgi:hypothetical protein
MLNDTQVVAVMHYGVYNILKFVFSYSELYNLFYQVVSDLQTSFLTDLSITSVLYRTSYDNFTVYRFQLSV